jgi:hypothetical protein
MLLALEPRLRAQAPLLGEPHRYLPSLADRLADVAAGDIDLDGDLDLVLATSSGARVYVNRDSGRFALAPAAIPGTINLPKAVALGDVDGDGDLDLVFGNGDYFSFPGGERNRLYLNTGSGSFIDATVQLPAIADATSSLALGDVDGDGDLDLLIGNSGEDNTSEQNELWLNSGAGIFSDATWRLPVLSDATWDVALADVDGDGDLDALIANLYPGNRLLFNDGSGSFTEAVFGVPLSGLDQTHALALGDVDGDGDLDVVLGTLGQDRLYLNDGSGFFSDASGQLPMDVEEAQAIALRDMDADGDLDILVGNYSQDRLYLNNGAGVFSDATASQLPARGGTVALAMGDCDLDGDLDVVFGSQLNGGTYLALNDGNGSLSDIPSQLPVSATGVCYALAIGDVNGDLLPDALIGTSGVAKSILLQNQGGGSFVDASSQLPAHTDYNQSVALGDVDGDGDLDALIGNGGLTSSSQQQNRLYLNDGLGVFSDATSQLPVILDNTREVVLGDLDGDGDLDAWVGNYNQQNFVLRNNGLGVFSVAVGAFPTGSFLLDAVALGDLDGDGDLDAVLGIFFGQNQLWLNDGTGTFVNATGQLPPDGDQTWSLALGDVDGDGDLDILLGNRVQIAPHNTAHRLYLNNGSAVFTDATAQLPPGYPGMATTEVSLGDIVGDGDLDALLGTYGQDRLFLNDGLGNFSDAPARIPVDVDATFAIVLADLDQDGDLDALLGNIGAPVRLLSSLERQLAWRHVPAIGKTLSLNVNGPPGGAFALYASTDEAYTPMPNYGILQLNRQNIFFKSVGALDALGQALVARPIPNNPALIGTTWYWQALVTPPRRFTNLERTTLTGL